MAPMTVTLDRSAFHGINWHRLRESRLSDLCRTGQVRVHHSSVLFEETLRLCLREEHHDMLREQMTYLLSIANGRWFRATRDLLKSELGWMTPRPDHAFEPTYNERRMRKSFSYRLQQDLKPDMKQLHAIERNHIRNQQLRQMRIQLRDKIISARRVGALSKHDVTPFGQIYRDNVEEFTRLKIEELAPVGRDVESILEEWRSGARAYPYLDLWVKGAMFLPYDAAAHHHQPIHRNDAWDLEVILVAKDVDVVVSSDEGFMQNLFAVLYHPPKQYLTPTLFLDLLEGLGTSVEVA